MTRQSWRRGIQRALAILVLIVGGLYYWFLVQSPRPAAAFVLDLTEVRRLAASIDGDRAKEIRFEHVMDFKAPAAIVTTGEGWGQRTLWGIAYQLVYPDHTMLIDTAMSPEQAAALGTISAHYADAYARLVKAMSRASLIVLTHEHPDHIGGLAAHPEFLSNARLTSEQATDPQYMLPVKIALGDYKPFQYDHYAAIAPGVVLIKSPGHSPGSQMVYVQLADGGEFLFLGDVGWSMRNVELVRGRPRAISMTMDEDRAAVLAQLTAVHELMKAEPKLHVIPGHDGDVVSDLVKAGVMKQGLE